MCETFGGERDKIVQDALPLYPLGGCSSYQPVNRQEVLRGQVTYVSHTVQYNNG